MPVRTAGALVFPLLMIKQHNTFSFWNGYQINPKICQNILYSHCFMSQNKFILTFLKMDLRRSGFIFLCLEFIIYGKLPFEYTYGFLERIDLCKKIDIMQLWALRAPKLLVI